MILRAEDDRRVLLLAGQVIEVDHQLEVRIRDRVHQLEPFARGVDDVGLLLPERLDRDGDAVRARLDRGAPAEVDELLEGLVFRESVGHAPGAAAAEDDDLDAELRQSRERLPHVRHLRLGVDLRSGDLQRRRQEQVGGRRGDAERLDLRGRGVEIGVAERGDFGRADSST